MKYQGRKHKHRTGGRSSSLKGRYSSTGACAYRGNEGTSENKGLSEADKNNNVFVREEGEGLDNLFAQYS